MGELLRAEPTTSSGLRCMSAADMTIAEVRQATLAERRPDAVAAP
jgi:hypothetical protein